MPIMKHLFFLFLPLLLLFSCSNTKVEVVEYNAKDSIYARGSLRATLNHNGTDYYIYKGKALGFHLELLEDFALYMGLDLEINTYDNIKDEYKSIAEHESDLLVGNFSCNYLSRDFLSRSKCILKQPLVLVQRKSHDNPVIKDIDSLRDIQIHIPIWSHYRVTLREDSRIRDNNVSFVFDAENNTENLIENLSNAIIDYTVCEAHVAKAYSKYYNNIDVSLQVSDTIPMFWLAHKNNQWLADSVNTWLKSFQKTQKFKSLINKYYTSSYSVVSLKNTLPHVQKNELSKYDKTFKKVAKKHKWDWRMYASIVYLESKFKDGLTGFGGSFGLLQLMPVIAEKYGISEDMSGDEQIERGAEYLLFLENKYGSEIEDVEQLWKFIVAAYNAGSTHVDDARKIALKIGKDPNVWDNNVDTCLLLKSKSKYYKMPELKGGYHYGKRTTNYVKKFWTIYQHYKNVFPK